MADEFSLVVFNYSCYGLLSFVDLPCSLFYYRASVESTKGLNQTLLIFAFVGAGSVYLITSNLNVGSVTEPTGIAVIGCSYGDGVFVSIMFYMGVPSIGVRMFVEFYRNGKQPIVAQNLISGI